MPKIAYIDPVGPGGATPLFKQELSVVANAGTEIEYLYFSRGPEHLEYRYYEALITTDLMLLIKELGEKGYDGCVIGCFYDPGLYAAREVSGNMTVTSLAESSLYLASILGNKFSILVGREKHIPRMMENIKLYGMEDRLASFKALGLRVQEFHEDEGITEELMIKKAEEAIKYDGAEVIVLGCSMTIGFYEKLQEILGVPVIDPVIAAFKHTEYLIQLRDCFGWKLSRINAFQAPPANEEIKWKLKDQYMLGRNRDV